jgi:hypothetical protein
MTANRTWSPSMAKPLSPNPGSGLSIVRCAAFSSHRTDQPRTTYADATKKTHHMAFVDLHPELEEKGFLSRAYKSGDA